MLEKINLDDKEKHGREQARKVCSVRSGVPQLLEMPEQAIFSWGLGSSKVGRGCHSPHFFSFLSILVLRFVVLFDMIPVSSRRTPC